MLRTLSVAQRVLLGAAAVGLGLLLVGLLWPARPYGLDLVVQWTGVQVLGWGVVAALAWRRHRRVAIVLTAGLGVVAALSAAAYWPGSEQVLARRRVPLGVVVYNAAQTDALADPAFVSWMRQRDPDLMVIVEVRQDRQIRAAWRDAGYHFDSDDKMAIISRYPLTPVLPMSFNKVFRTVQVQVTKDLSILCSGVQFLSPRSEERWQMQLATATALAQRQARATLETGQPYLMAGDFNSTPLGRGYQTFYRISSLGDSCPSLWRGGTWPSWLPSALAIPIDHVWTTPHMSTTRYEVGPKCQSDHRPVYVEMTVADVGGGGE